MYRRFLLPYVEQFWRDTAAVQRVRLSGPDAVLATLQTACDLPEGRRLRPILSAVLTGVRLTGVPAQVQEWLREEG